MPGFYFVGYSFSFCTPLLVLAPEVPASAHLIKKPVYCKECTQRSHHPQDTLTLLTPLCKTPLRRGLLRNAEKHFSTMEKKKALQVMFRCVCGGKTVQENKFVNGLHGFSLFGKAFEGYQYPQLPSSMQYILLPTNHGKHSLLSPLRTSLNNIMSVP